MIAKARFWIVWCSALLLWCVYNGFDVIGAHYSGLTTTLLTIIYVGCGALAVRLIVFWRGVIRRERDD